MDQVEVINKVRNYGSLVREYFPVEKIYLYGSYARGNYRTDIDIDVAVVVDKVEGDYFSTRPLLWKLRRQIDDRIEPILIEKEFDETDFLSEIEKYGIEIV